jgi:hypothetical protein
MLHGALSFVRSLERKTVTPRSFVWCALLAAVGCKGKPEHRSAPSNAHADGSAAAAGSAGAARSADMGSNSDHTLPLPKGNGTPPKPTKAPLDDATATKLLALTFPRFLAEPKGHNSRSTVIEYHTDDRPKLKVTVQIQPCNAACVPIELAKWEKLDTLKEFLPPELRGLRDTKFEVGATEINGATMIYTYQAGMSSTADGTRYSDTYVLYYNDGMNQIRTVAMYADNKPDSIEHMLKMAPEEDLENLAKAFLDVFTQAWAE